MSKELLVSAAGFTKEAPLLEETVLMLRMFQLHYERQIAEEDKRGITLRMREILRRKLNVDQVLSDLSADMALAPGYERRLDEELKARGWA